MFPVSESSHSPFPLLGTVFSQVPPSLIHLLPSDHKRRLLQEAPPHPATPSFPPLVNSSLLLLCSKIFYYFLVACPLPRASLVTKTVKNLPACGKHGFNPWVGKIPWKRKWQLTPIFLPGESHGQRSLAGYSSCDCKESDMTKRLTIHFIFGPSLPLPSIR